MVHELVRYMKSVNMHGGKIKISNCIAFSFWSNVGKDRADERSHLGHDNVPLDELFIVLKKSHSAFIFEGKACQEAVGTTDQWHSAIPHKMWVLINNTMRASGLIHVWTVPAPVKHW